MHHNFPASSAPAYPPLPPPPRWFSNAQPPTPLAAQAFPPPYTGFNGNSRPPLLPNWIPPPNNQPAINYPPPNACQPQPLSSLRQYGPPSASNSYDHLNGTNNVKNSSSQIYNQVEEEKEAESNHVSQDGPEEYQGRREEKLARRKQTYYCETCNIQCSGQISYESHLEGKHHKRKLNAANGGIQGIAADPRRSGAAYKCEICNVLCSAEDVYQGHVSGQKHQRAIKNLLQTNRPIPAVALVDVFAPTVVVEQDDGQKKNNNNMAQEAKKRKSSSGSGPVENANLVPLGGGGSGMPTPLGLGGANAIAMVPEHINDRLVLDKVQRVQLSADQWAAIDQLASLVEETLCTVSSIIESQRAASSTAPSANSERLLRGSMRVGLLANRLLLKSDRRADLVLLCSVIPTQRILNQITEMFRLYFSQAEAAMGYAGPATIVMEVPTESAFTIYRAHTSLTIYVTLTCSKMRQWSPGDLNYYPYPEPPMALPKASCLYALAEMRRTKFYEVKSELHKSMSTTVKIAREFVNRVPAWSRMDSWMIQLLVEKVLSLHPMPLGPSAALKALFKAISDDHILEVNPTLLDPCEKLPIDVFAPLSPAERQNIFASARYALRQINIGQMAKLLALDGGSGIPQQQAEPRPKKPRFAGHASNNNSSQEEVNRIEGVNNGIGSVGRMAAKAPPPPPPMATGANREPVVWNPEGRTSLGNSTVPQFPNFPPNL